MFAGGYASAGKRVSCLGMLASAILCAAHSRLADRREWALNEKQLVERAGLQGTETLLVHDDKPSASLADDVAQVSEAIGVDPLQSR